MQSQRNLFFKKILSCGSIYMQKNFLIWIEFSNHTLIVAPLSVLWSGKHTKGCRRMKITTKQKKEKERSKWQEKRHFLPLFASAQAPSITFQSHKTYNLARFSAVGSVNQKALGRNLQSNATLSLGVSVYYIVYTMVFPWWLILKDLISRSKWAFGNSYRDYKREIITNVIEQREK